MFVLSIIVRVFLGILALAFVGLMWSLFRAWKAEDAEWQAVMDEQNARWDEELPLLRKILHASASEYEGMNLAEAMAKARASAALKKEKSDGA
ncbi:hypothetical protein LCGC14_1395150 [marine sediment metagenome]|uniref:Uncharacterized protein n=1 Tax=marine sediment metagenome TaxID=412755 RepID=A0A0F9JYY5_9ZZZZ